MLNLWRYCYKYEDRKTQLYQQVTDNSLQNKKDQLCNICGITVTVDNATGAGWDYYIIHKSYASQDIFCLVEAQ